MSRPEWSAAHELAVTVEQNNLDGDVGVGDDRRGRLPCRRSNHIAERDALRARIRESLRGRIGAGDALRQRRGTAGRTNT